MFKSHKLSLLAQGLPLLALFPFLFPQAEQSILAPFIFFIAIILSDNGHIFVTAFKIFSPHRSRQEKIKFSLIIAGSISLSTLWLGLQIPYFWSFFLYFTAFHHLKQNLGLFKWLARSENQDSKYLNIFAYACFLIPFLFFHLRSDISAEGIAYGLLPLPPLLKNLYTDPLLINRLRLILSASLLTAAVAFMFKNGKNEKSFRIGFYVLSVTALNVFSMMYGKTFFEIYTPLVISHGLTYFLTISDSLVKVQKWSLSRSLTTVLSGALIYGIVDWYLQADDLFQYLTNPLAFWALMGAGLTAGLNMAHYYIDGLIWKKEDVDSSLVFYF
ncbi:MAG: hypothetical protein ACXWRE_06580 [Pseudobdellovibrionaceae bacterium]